MRASAAATAVSRLAAILSAARARLAYGQWSVKWMWRKAVQTMILHADAADGGDRGAEAADEVVVVEVELGREASSQSWRTVDGRVAVGGVLVSKWCEAMASGRPNMNACHLRAWG